VADRFRLWGKPGEKGVAWGNWDNFVSYTSTLNFGITGTLLRIIAVSATILEITLGVSMLIGFKIKWASFASGVMLLLFGLAMCINTKLKFALDYSVFSAAGCCLLLYLHPKSKWSVDNLLKQ
jgi:uncharacterized membrane protein YphA (DoxX/SURF4 family)